MKKPDYDTIRGLESKARPVFRFAAILGMAGLFLTVFGFGLNAFGIILLIIAGVIAFYEMMLMQRLEKAEPIRQIFCPYCASKNEVFMSRREFACDVCSRRIGVSPAGEVTPLEEIEEDD
ncbi:MAG: hypothetical protein HYX78_08970 [Armatimonadetes bacterium]|nr:hypothetical protein [Armatimonadota bacterium]